MEEIQIFEVVRETGFWAYPTAVGTKLAKLPTSFDPETDEVIVVKKDAPPEPEKPVVAASMKADIEAVKKVHPEARAQCGSTGWHIVAGFQAWLEQPTEAEAWAYTRGRLEAEPEKPVEPQEETDEQKVRKVYPDAWCYVSEGGQHGIRSRAASDAEWLSARGDSEAKAWANAAKRLDVAAKRDEYNPPIPFACEYHIGWGAHALGLGNGAVLTFHGRFIDRDLPSTRVCLDTEFSMKGGAV